METRGDGPYTHGNSFANGPIVPAWLRNNREYALARESEFNRWTVQA